MKYLLTFIDLTRFYRSCIAVVMLCSLAAAPVTAWAQTDSTASETPAPEEKMLISPSLELSCTQKGEEIIELKALLKAKINGTLYKLPKLKVTFYAISDSAEKELGFVITNSRGLAVYTYPADSLSKGNNNSMQFRAVFAGNKSMEAAEEEVRMKRALLKMEPVKDDSLLTVKIKLVDRETDTAIREATVGIFVKRTFLPLKVGEGTTDESGEATVEIPASLPGDAKGNITLLARLDENEVYGNLETVIVQPWGTPVSDKIAAQPRALWSTLPPLWMLITFIVLMTAVWGHYIVIIYELFRLRKEHPHTS